MVITFTTEQGEVVRTITVEPDDLTGQSFNELLLEIQEAIEAAMSNEMQGSDSV